MQIYSRKQKKKKIVNMFVIQINTKKVPATNACIVSATYHVKMVSHYMYQTFWH